MDEHDELMEDYDFDNDVLEFDPIYYPEPIRYLETIWQRPLEYYEKYLVAETYNWVRHNITPEEVKIIDLPTRKGVWYDSNLVLRYTPLHHNEPIVYLSEKWGRPLNNHEMHIMIEIYDWSRTQLEREEIFFVEWMINSEEEEN